MHSLDAFAQAKLDALEKRNLRRALAETAREDGVWVERGGRRLLSFSCNDYLNLSQHPTIKAAVMTAVQEYGAGAGASRLITGNHPLSIGVCGSYSRESANRVVNRADLVCFIGTETGGMTTHFWAVPAIGTPAIQIDIEPQALGRNYPLQASVLGDAKAVLSAMLASADKASAKKREAWVKEIATIRVEWYAKYKADLESNAVPIHPARICAELTKHVPDDGIVVVDTGHAGMWMGGMYDLRKASQSYMRSAGHLGWAFPAALGAKAACPDRPVVCFTGDAGLWYHIAEIETAVRWKLNAVVLVNNNGGGNQSKRGFDRAYGGEPTARSRELWTYNPMNFARLAEDMGALGIRVENAANIAPALRKALAANRPVVIDVASDIEMLAPTAVT